MASFGSAIMMPVELDDQVIAVFRSLLSQGHAEAGSLLSRCRFQYLDDRILEVAGNREFYSVMHGDGEVRRQILAAIEDGFGIGEDSVTAVYLPSALAQQVPDWRDRLR